MFSSYQRTFIPLQTLSVSVLLFYDSRCVKSSGTRRRNASDRREGEENEGVRGTSVDRGRFFQLLWYVQMAGVVYEIRRRNVGGGETEGREPLSQGKT